jgi:hypothetical protein
VKSGGSSFAHSADAERTQQLVLVEPCAGLDGHLSAGLYRAGSRIDVGERGVLRLPC